MNAEQILAPYAKKKIRSFIATQAGSGLLQEAGVMNLREFARGQQCQVRLEGCLAPSTETVVLAHIRRANIAGMGQKPPDLCGVHACQSCHDRIDSRTASGLTRLELDHAILFALLRTLVIVQKELEK